jgi:hypothetical protein
MAICHKDAFNAAHKLPYDVESEGGMIIFTALRPIKQGEPLTFSYSAEVLRDVLEQEQTQEGSVRAPMALAERRALLEAKLGFKCYCARCVGEEREAVRAEVAARVKVAREEAARGKVTEAETAKAASTQVETTKAGLEAAKAPAAKAAQAAAKAETTKAEAAKAEIAKAEIAKADVVKVAAVKTEAAKTEAAKAEVAKGEAAKREVAAAEAPKAPKVERDAPIIAPIMTTTTWLVPVAAVLTAAALLSVLRRRS